MKQSIEREAGFAIVNLSGRIEWDDARKLDHSIKALVDAGESRIVFVLNDVTYICSAGIGALVYNLSAARKNNGAIYMVYTSEYIDYMFETLKFDMVFEGYIYPSIDDFRSGVIGRQQDK